MICVSIEIDMDLQHGCAQQMKFWVIPYQNRKSIIERNVSYK